MKWLLRLLLNDADRRAVESDLAELFELRERQEGDRAARRWLWRQRGLLVVHVLVDRVGAVSPGWKAMEHLWRDFRYTLRSLGRVPVLSITIVMTVGIGLGAATAMITAVRAVLVNPLPYDDPGSLVWLYTDNPPYRFRFSLVDYRALEADHASFAAVAAYRTGTVTITDRTSAERATAKSVTGSYFPLLGQKPHLGRLFDDSDDARKDRIAVLTHAYWTRRFGADESVPGRTIKVDGEPYTIVGVLQRRVGPLENNVALFTAQRWAAPTRKGPFHTMAIARLRPDVSRAAATDALRATNRRLFPIWRSSYQDERATWGMMDLKERAIGSIGSTLLFVLAAVMLVLLIACANAINLLIARGLHRTRELAIRGALGASRGRLLQHVLVEAGVLTAGAALVGLGFAAGALQLITRYGVDYIPRTNEIRLSAAALGWLGVLTLSAGAIVGLVPAMHAARVSVKRSLGTAGRSSTDGPAARRVRRALVATEFALATPLLVAAVLVLASLDRLARVPVGVDLGRLMTASVSLTGGAYAEDTVREAFWKRALERLETLPGVEAAALSDSRPPRESGQRNNFDLEDRPTPAGENQPICTWVGVSPDFFETVGLRLERGRLLDERSIPDNVVVVDRAWANRFFPGQDVLGRRFRNGGCTTCPWTTVVGVVSNVKWIGLEAPEDGTVYFPIVDVRDAFVILRSAADPGPLAPALQQVMRELDSSLAVSEVASGSQLVSEALANPRYLSVLTGALALTALVLSLVGIYGVMTHFVQQHARDIGIRLALGGEPARVRRMVVLQGLRLVVAGVVAGIVAAVVTSGMIRTLLFGVEPTDIRVLAGVPALLFAVAIAACFVPARRAAALDPAVILRDP